MLVVTEVFLAPPTHGEKESETGRGRMHRTGREREKMKAGRTTGAFRKKGEREEDRQITETAGGRYYYEGMFYSDAVRK